MTDQEFIDAFEACTLPAETFHHEQHVRVVWLYLQKFSVLQTLERFSERLKAFATANGKPNLYHETITWAYVLLIQERIRRSPLESWEDFKKTNSDLLDWTRPILKQYYSEDTLRSEFAKKVFVFPDRG